MRAVNYFITEAKRFSKLVLRSESDKPCRVSILTQHVLVLVTLGQVGQNGCELAWQLLAMKWRDLSVEVFTLMVFAREREAPSPSFP